MSSEAGAEEALQSLPSSLVYLLWHSKSQVISLTRA